MEFMDKCEIEVLQENNSTEYKIPEGNKMWNTTHQSQYTYGNPKHWLHEYTLHKKFDLCLLAAGYCLLGCSICLSFLTK